jgi:hypothetical protein
MKRANSAPIIGERPNLTSALLYFAAAALLCAVFWNLYHAGLFTRRMLATATYNKIAAADLVLALIFVLLAQLTRKLRWLNSLTKRDAVTGSVLAGLILSLPLFIMEQALRPFAKFQQNKTTIYLKDPELGWRLRPNATDLWAGVTVRTNSKGLRGPEIAYDKPPGVTRLLFLGDSVTFGDGLKTVNETFPFLIGQELTAQLKRKVEVINSGVSGYSPWQEALYLEKEGIKYHPDLVVVTFALNDVTEKFELPQFGGTGEGWQLSHNYSSFSEWLADHSGIAYFARRIGARIRFGPNLQQGAQRKETLNIRSLVDFPQRDDVKEAWKLTLQEVDRIIDFCRGHDIPLLLVISPWRFQLLEEDVTEWPPQKIVSEHARTRGVPVIDLLPGLITEMKRRGGKPVDSFLEKSTCHFSAVGCQLVTEQVVNYIVGRNVIGDATTTAAHN